MRLADLIERKCSDCNSKIYDHESCCPKHPDAEITKTLEPYAWPGGYQFLYLTPEGCVLCPDCATEALDDNDPKMRPSSGFYRENDEEPEFCEDCNKQFGTFPDQPEDEAIAFL